MASLPSLLTKQYRRRHQGLDVYYNMTISVVEVVDGLFLSVPLGLLTVQEV